MKITTSDRYGHGSCVMDDCERNYCAEHRLLWRTCDTVKSGYEGSGRMVYETGDCPDCESDEQHKKYARILAEQESQHIEEIIKAA